MEQVGKLVGGIVGVLVAAYGILPLLHGDVLLGAVLSLVCIVAGAVLGQMLVVSMSRRA